MRVGDGIKKYKQSLENRDLGAVRQSFCLHVFETMNSAYKECSYMWHPFRFERLDAWRD